MQIEKLIALLVTTDSGEAERLQELVTTTPPGTLSLEVIPHLNKLPARASAARLLLLDLDQADLSPLALCSRAQSFYPQLPIVTLSSTADEPLFVALLEAGVQDCLVKGEMSGAQLVRAARFAAARHLSKVAPHDHQPPYHLITDATADVLLTVDATGRICFANSVSEAVLGYAPADLIGQSFECLLPPAVGAEHRVTFPQLLQEEHREKGPYPLELLARHKAGHELYLHLTVKEAFHDGEPLFVCAIRDMTEREQFLRRLNEIIEIVASAVRLDEMLPGLADRLGQLIAADNCYIDLWDATTGAVSPAAASGRWHHRYRSTPVTAAETTVTEAVLASGRSLIISNVRQSPYFSPRLAALPPIGSLLATPLSSGGEKLGAVLFAFEQPHHFRADEIARCEQAVAQVALAVARAQLSEATRRQLEELKVLHALAAASSEAINEDVLLERATAVLATTLYSDNFGILLVDEEKGVLIQHPSYRYGDSEIKVDQLPLGQGVTGQVAVTGRSWRIADVSQEPAYLDLDPDTRSELCVPIKMGERVIGVINTESQQEAAFTEADEQLLATMARQLATAMEKIRLLEAERRRRQEAEMLREASLALTATLDLGQVLERLLVQLAQLLDYDSAGILLLKGDGLVVVGAHGFPMQEQVLGRRYPGKNRLFQVLQETGQPLWLDDAQNDPRFDPWEGFRYVRGWLGIPLKVRGEVIGMLTLDNRELGAYGPAEADLAQTLANQAAIAVENARLFAAAQRRAVEPQILSDILRRLNGTPDLSQAFPDVMNSLKSISGCARVSVALLDEERKWVTMFALDRPQPVLGEGVRFPISATMAAEDVMVGQVHLTPDLSAEIEFPAEQSLYQAGFHSRVNLPLYVEDRVIGSLNLVWQEKQGYNEEQLPLLGQIADALALALARTRLFEEAQRRAEQLAALQATQLDIMSEHDLDILLQTIVQRATALLETTAGSLYLCDPVQQQARCVVSYNNTRDYTGLSLNYGEGIVGRVAASGRPVTLDGQEISHRPDESNQDGEAPNSVSAAPMIWQGQVTGVLLGIDVPTRRFRPEDVELLTLFANQAAIALQNARLIDRTRRRAQELEALVALSVTMRITQAIDEMLNHILAHVADIVDGATSCVYLVEPETASLSLRACRPDMVAMTDKSRRLVEEVLDRFTALGPEDESDQFDFATENSEDGFLALPLRTEKHVMGVLLVILSDARPFTENEVQLLTAIAEMAGGALQRARIMETLEQRVAERTHELADANDRLKELDLLKSKFVSDVSHELRTPVTNLGLYLELLESGKEARRNHYLQILKKETRRLGQLIEDILSLSRLDLGKTQVAFGHVDLNTLVGQVVSVHQPRAEAAELALIFEPEPDLPLIYGEWNQLAQVVTNLISNALNYTPDGQITITTFTDAQRGQVCLQVQDTGVGIVAEDQPHLFERFYRGHFASQSNIAGNGLGLAIVDEIVNLHRGEIEVDSLPDQGAIFRVWLWPGI